jgi:cytochrome P450
MWLAGGTVVGINPWVAARDKEVYGEDSEIFKPERWLDADEKGLKAMERNFLAVSLRRAYLDDTLSGNAL